MVQSILALGNEGLRCFTLPFAPRSKRNLTVEGQDATLRNPRILERDLRSCSMAWLNIDQMYAHSFHDRGRLAPAQVTNASPAHARLALALPIVQQCGRRYGSTSGITVLQEWIEVPHSAYVDKECRHQPSIPTTRVWGSRRWSGPSAIEREERMHRSGEGRAGGRLLSFWCIGQNDRSALRHETVVAMSDQLLAPTPAFLSAIRSGQQGWPLRRCPQPCFSRFCELHHRGQSLPYCPRYRR